MGDWIAFLLWMGGIGVAYRRNRARGSGRISSSIDAFAWPYGVGHRLARDYYFNENWPAPASPEDA